ncbi:MAG: hypothetical protein HRU20_15140 [Pseudomonadales bacterium]|nr:hypothetical protein [Pseudomonadales bacterium]
MFKRTSFAFGLVVLGTGCAQWLPAASHEIEPGVFKITATGNSFASTDDLRKKVEKKAAKVCGDQAYKKASKDKYQSHKQRTYTDSGYQTSHYFTYTTTVECVSTAQEQAPTA